MANKIERRDLAAPVALKESGPGKASRLVGYAARFDVESQPLHDRVLGGFIEVIRPGAFARSLRESPDVKALVDHDTASILGRTKSGTLKLREDAVGLAYEVLLPDTQLGRDVKVMVARGDLDAMSFGFYVVEDLVGRRDDGMKLRELLDVTLLEVSFVTFPAYADTSVALRHKARRIDPGTPILDLATRRLRMLDLG